MAVKHVLILEGANLNKIGTRETHIYGTLSVTNQLESWKMDYSSLVLSYFQTNFEGELIEKIQNATSLYDAIVINPGGFTHYGVALKDALLQFKKPIIEVHYSNIYAREAFRAHSMVSSAVTGVISGLGIMGYKLALDWLANELN